MKSVFTKIKARRAAMLLLVGVMTLTAQMAWAQTTSFPTTSGGAGTENDPYLIMTPADLNTLASDVNSGTNYSNTYFKLGTNIAYSHKADNEEGANTENNYTAIGTSSNPFSGTFDGMGYTVSGIRIYKGGTTDADSYQGLFGMVSGGTIKNVMLTDARITGYQNVGGIVGYLENGVIDGCCNTGYIKAGMDCAGGIAGRMSSTTNAACYVQKSFNSGYVKGRNQVGGIVGRMSNQNYFSNCYNTGVVKGIAQVGGLVGLQEDPTVASGYSYSAGWVEASSMAGAVCGFSTDPTKIVNCHYDNLMCSYKGVNEQDVAGVTGHSTSEMVGTGLGFSDGWVTDGAMYPRLSAFAASTAGIASALTVDFGTDFQGEYKKAYDLPSVGGADYTLPSNEELSWEHFEGTINMLKKDGNQDIIHTSGVRTMEVICAKKDGTAYRYLKFSLGISERNPIMIENIDGKKISDLCYLINTSESEFMFNNIQIPDGGDGYYFSLQNGINYIPMGMWTPIGTSEHPFKGYIDGKNDIGENSTITILYDGASSDYVGLFGYMQGRVKNVTVTGDDNALHIFIKGRDYVGAIAGYCHGTIESCAVLAACDGFGKIEGRNYVGGLVGQAFYSQILNCSNGCNVQGDNHVGGIVGDCSASVVSGCVNTATICGTCGVDDPATGDVDESQNVTWLYDVSTSTLTISGTGAMADYASADDQPWKDYRSSIASVAIGDGVTSIGSYAFSGCTSLTSVALNGAATIGSDAFPSTATVTIADGLYLHNGSEVLSGNVTDMSKLNGKTLVSVTVIVPELTVSDGDITATTAIATWTACDNVSSYTLQLSADGPILSEDFAGFTPTSSTNISSTLDDYTSTSGWTGSKVYPEDETAKIGNSDGEGWIMTPALNASGTLTVVWSAKRNENSGDSNTLLLGISEDGTNFVDETITIDDDMTEYTNTFNVSGPTVYVRWMGEVKPDQDARFYLDNVSITTSSEFTVTNTSYTFTGLTPETTYDARVKGDAGWSNVVNFTTAPAPDSAPVWSAFPAMTINVDETDDIIISDYVTGKPTPSITLISTTAETNEYGFSDGVLSFNPSTAGTYTFTFTAANSEGSAVATLTITASPAPVTVPTLTVDDVTATTAIATWTACDNVSSYTIQLASDDQFSTGGAGNSVTLFSNDGTDATSAPTGWTYNVSGKASAYLLMFSGHSVVSEAVNAFACTDLSVSLDIRTYGGTSQPNLTIQYSTDNGSSWTDAGTVAAANSTMAERTLDLPAAAASSELRLRFAPNTTSSSIGVGIKSIVLTGSQSAGDGSLIAEYSVTDGTSYTFTGLTPETTYYARVKGDDDWSNIEDFTTDDAGNTAPTWSASFPTTATIAAGEDYELQDVSTYTSGTPFPAVTLTSASSNANSNDYSFEDDIFRFNTSTPGTYTFTFTAANGTSPDATATLTVTVNDWTELKEIDDPLAVLTAQSGNMVPVKFTRSGLTAGAYSTVCLPFAFEAPEGCAFYTFVGVAQDASGEWFADVTAAEPPYLANTPYIFKSATATSVDFTNESVVAAASYSDANAKTVVSSDWTIQGTYSRIDLPKEGEHAYGFTSTAGKSVQNNDLEAGTFVYLVTGAWAAPFRAYLKYTGSDAAWQKGRTRFGAAALPSSITVRIVGSKGTATEIGTLRLETEDGEWYSLDGRRLVGKPATKGIYIKDGKKVIVK